MVEAIIDALVGILGLSMTGVVAWAFNLSNRVTALETTKSKLESDNRNLEKLFESKLEDVIRRLDSIDRKLDLT